MRPIASLLEGAARPPDHLCGLGYSPSDPRQTKAENAVLTHAERALNLVHAYCEIRDSWTGWLRGAAMGRTLYDRLLPELRALQAAERRIVDAPTVTLLDVLHYAARARRAVPAYTPREGIDYPQPAIPDAVREACARMRAEAVEAALAAKRTAAREYAARMADAIERELAEETRRQRAMAEHGVVATADEAAAARAALDGRIAVYERERDQALADAGLAPEGAGDQDGLDGKPKPAAELPAPDNGHTIAWRIVRRRRRAVVMEATPETVPPFAHRLVLIDRGAQGGELRAFGSAELDGRQETLGGVAVRFAHRPKFAARLRRDADRYVAWLTRGQVQGLRS